MGHAERTREPGAGRERNRVLVGYATRHGSTKGVAERIADTLAGRGLDVELRPVDEVESVRGYSAVVFGSPVYSQRWLPEAEEFLRRHLSELDGERTWLFSVGTFGDRKRLLGSLVKREPRDIGRIRSSLRPREYRVFAGVIDAHQWPFASRLLLWSLGGRLGDCRDWRDIAAWADEIAEALSGRAAG